MSIAPVAFDWDGEVWVKCAQFPSYSVSSHGRVRRDMPPRGVKNFVPRFLAMRALPLGHLQVTLSENNSPVTVLVHRLVAEAFLPLPLPEQDCVCHRDDDPRNNYPDNLFWGTRTDNMNDMKSKNRQARGRRVVGCKLTEDQIGEVRSLLAQGLRQRAIAARFGISQSNVSMIGARLTWGHVS